MLEMLSRDLAVSVRRTLVCDCSRLSCRVQQNQGFDYFCPTCKLAALNMLCGLGKCNAASPCPCQAIEAIPDHALNQCSELWTMSASGSTKSWSGSGIRNTGCGGLASDA